MVATIRSNSETIQKEVCHDRFLELLPQIQRQASIAFRSLRSEAREEHVAEVVARAYCLYLQLVRRGKQELAYATPLAQFAIRMVRAGRRVGCRLNKHDVTSPYGRRTHGRKFEQLELDDIRAGDWTALIVEDRSAGPAETAAARLDLAAWYRTLPVRNRRIAKFLALGEATAAASQRFCISPGRISQLRNCLRANWLRFQRSEQPTC
jgi:hypothetical protein